MIVNFPTRIYKRSMPSFCPNNFRSQVLPEVQVSSCGPGAAANIIAYQASKGGFSRLMPPLGSHDKEYGYLKLIEELTDYMDTTETGTFALGLIKGIEKYIRDRGYVPSIEWAGEHYTGKYKKKNQPSMEWIMKKTLGPSNALLWIGNYECRPRSLKAMPGHCVTVAGFNQIYDELFIHDPSPNKRKKPIEAEVYTLAEKPSDDYEKLCSYISPSELLLNSPYKTSEEITIIEAALALQISPK